MSEDLKQNVLRQTGHVTLLSDIAGIVNQAKSLSDAFKVALECICRHMNWPIGHIYMPSGDESIFRDTGIWSIESPKAFTNLIEVSRQTTFKSGEALVGRVIATGEPLWIDDLDNSQEFKRNRKGIALGVRTVFMFPVLVRDRVAAVLEFFAVDRVQRDQQVLDVMVQIGTQLGQVVERQNAQQELSQRAEVLHLLYETALEINRTETLEDAMRYVLQRVSEHNGWCFGHVFLPADDNEDELQAINVYYQAAPGRFDQFRALTLRLPIEKGEGLPGRVFTSGKPEWTHDIGSDLLDGRAQIGDELSIGTGLAFPVLIGQEVVAVLEFFADNTFEPDKVVIESMASIGMQLGLLAERERAANRLRQHQTELAHANRVDTISALVANIAHELNQPLSAIVNYVGGAIRRLRDTNTDPLVLDRLRQAVTLAEQAADIVETVRAFLRKKEVEQQAVDMGAVIERALELIATEARRKRVAMHVDLLRDLPAVKGSPIQLEQVLLNIVRNGIEALEDTPVDRRVVLVRAFENGKGEIEVVVKDNGVGISAEILPKLFEPFTSSKPEGLGMGLALAKMIIETHRGRLWVGSNDDAGTDFHIALPVYNIDDSI